MKLNDMSKLIEELRDLLNRIANAMDSGLSVNPSTTFPWEKMSVRITNAMSRSGEYSRSTTCEDLIKIGPLNFQMQNLGEVSIQEIADALDSLGFPQWNLERRLINTRKIMYAKPVTLYPNADKDQCRAQVGEPYDGSIVRQCRRNAKVNGLCVQHNDAKNLNGLS